MPAPSTRRYHVANLNLPLRCPRCDSGDLEAVPTFDEDDATTGVVAIVCPRCGYHLEDVPASALKAREPVVASR
jgi:predicted Zn-ribbon and HTH transcriptional regulator